MDTTNQQRATVRPVAAPRKSGSELQLVKGRTMRDALLAARRELGARAVVVDQLTEAGGVTLVVSDTVPRSTQILSSMRETAAQMLEPVASPPVDPEPAAKCDVRPWRTSSGASASTAGAESSGRACWRAW